MRLSFSPAEQTFRGEARDFLRDADSPSMCARIENGGTLTGSDIVDWIRALSNNGWAAPRWPREQAAAALASRYSNQHTASVCAGPKEIHKNVICKAALGM